MKFFKGLMFGIAIELFLFIAIVGVYQLAHWWIK